jgi:hypothetical protein
MEQGLVDLIFEPFKISDKGWVRHVVLHNPENYGATARQGVMRAPA